MDAETQKRIKEIKARRNALHNAKGNYCAEWGAMHAIQGHAISDLDFLLALAAATPQETGTECAGGLTR